MSYMEWKDEYSVGIEQFDEHHKQLIHLLNLVYDAFTLGGEHDELEAVLDELVDYATYHFSAEEYWMNVHSYPALAAHSEEHDKFAARAVEIQKDFHNGRKGITLEVMQFLNSWLINHILFADAVYGKFAAALPHEH